MDTVLEIFPAFPIISIADAIEFNRMPRATASAIMDSALGKELRIANITAIAPTVRIIGVKFLITSLEIAPVLDNMRITPAIVSSNRDTAAAFAIAAFGSDSFESAITIPAIMPTMPVRTSSQSTALILTSSALMPEAIFVMRANAIIRLNRAPVALARSFPSIKDSATTTAAITPTAVVRAIIFCLAFEAPLVAQIIAVIQALRPAITANGFFMSTSFI